MPVVLGVALAKSGSPKTLADHIQSSHSYPMAVVVIGVLEGIASVLGAILAGYVLVRPLQLYRYETVALDEEMADKRSSGDGPAAASRRRVGGGAGSTGGGRSGLPIEAWVGAGEVRVLASARRGGEGGRRASSCRSRSRKRRARSSRARAAAHPAAAARAARVGRASSAAARRRRRWQRRDPAAAAAGAGGAAAAASDAGGERRGLGGGR